MLVNLMEGVMGRPVPRKEKWALSFDSKLKKLVINTAKRKSVSPATLLENLVREKFNPYGHADVKGSADYVMTLRKKSRSQTDDAFLKEVEAWEKSRSS
jgi:hypothetical protein